MKRMHATDGTKNYYQSYHYSNHHQHFNNNYTNNNGGYQQMNNNGSYHNNNNPNSYHNNYRNNYGNRRQYRNKHYQYNNNNHHAHPQYNNNNSHPPFHCVPHQMVQNGQMPDMNTLLSSSQVMDENSLHPQYPSQTPVVSCITPDPTGSKVTTKNENSTAHDTDDTLPLSQTNTPAPVQSITIPSNPPLVDLSPEGQQQALLTLSDAIWKRFLLNQQPLDVYGKKMELWRELYDLFKATHGVQYPRYMLQVVGSTMSGFGSRTSDVDVCLMIRKSEVDQRIEAVDRLHELQASLQKIPYMEKIELIYAKVPILKFRDASRELEVDLNCNNSVGIRNTHLLYCYSQLDWRVKPLVLVVKLWAQTHGINDAKNMTISSYSLVLMVIHYLQFGCKEPVLPCLHQMYPEKFAPFVDVEKIKINEQISKWDSQNPECLGELLIGFLEYYSRKFDYARQAVSVRLGCHVPIKLCMQARSYKNDPHQWKYLCVEEPFDFTNTARSVYDKEAFERIRGVFYTSWNRIAQTKDLNSIFFIIPEHESRAVAQRMPHIVLR